MARAPRTKTPPKYAAIKRIALALPETREIEDRLGLWFNIGKKTFVLFSTQVDRWIFRLPHHQIMMLIETRPGTFAPMRAGALFWVYADVDDLDAAELRDYVTAAWRYTVPKKILKAHLTGEHA
jgi:hypothetical protein